MYLTFLFLTTSSLSLLCLWLANVSKVMTVINFKFGCYHNNQCHAFPIWIFWQLLTAKINSINVKQQRVQYRFQRTSSKSNNLLPRRSLSLYLLFYWLKLTFKIKKKKRKHIHIIHLEFNIWLPKRRAFPFESTWTKFRTTVKWLILQGLFYLFSRRDFYAVYKLLALFIK